MMKTETRPLLPDGVVEHYWSEWPKDMSTARQLNERRLVPGVARGAIWYSHKGKGQPYWLFLYCDNEATPKVERTPEQIEARQRAVATSRENRRCKGCRSVQRAKRDLELGLCQLCREQNIQISYARETLAEDIVLLDTETTGFEGSEIISITVIDKQGEILLDTYIKPRLPIDEYGSACLVNGITNAMVEDAPPFPQVWLKLQSILMGKVVCCYNVQFDQARVEENCEMHGLSDFLIDSWFCVMELFADWQGDWSYKYKSNRWYSLSDACEILQVQGGDHTASGDVAATLDLLKALAALPFNGKEK